MAKMRKCFAAGAAALLFFAGGTASAAIKDVTVTSFAGLRSAVADASAGDTLRVVFPSYATVLAVDGQPEIVIDKPLTIMYSDPGVPILVKRPEDQGKGVFVVTASPVTLRGFRFVDSKKPGDAIDYNCCIRSTSDNLTLADCTFENWEGDVLDDDNRKTRDLDTTHAGAVTASSSSAGSRLLLDHCTFKGCSLRYRAQEDMFQQAWDHLGAAVSSRMGKTLVRNCSFIGNKATTEDGSPLSEAGVGALVVRDTNYGDAPGRLMIADSTFADNLTYVTVGVASDFETTATVLGSTFVHNAGPAVDFEVWNEAGRQSRLRFANVVMLNNDYEYNYGAGDVSSFRDDQVLITHSVVGECSSQNARSNIFLAGNDNWQQWFLKVENGLPQPSVYLINRVGHYAYPLSAYAYENGRNVSVPLLYDSNEVNPTVYTGLEMRSSKYLWYGDTTGSPTLHTKGIDLNKCYDEIEEKYYFSCGSAMSYPAPFNFEEGGKVVKQQKVMWNYGTLTMPSHTAPTGYKFLGWDGKYESGEELDFFRLLNDGNYVFSGDEPNTLLPQDWPIAYSIEYHGFNAAFDPQYHAYQTKVEYDLGWVEKSADVPVYGGLLNCTNEAARIAAYDQGCLGYSVKGWATSQERAQAGIVDYPLGQMLGGMHGGVDLTTEDGAVVKLWLVRTTNVGCGRFYKDQDAFQRGVDQCVAGVDYIEVPAMTGQDFVFPECPFARPGYQFKRWGQSVDVFFYAGQVWKNGDENFGNVYVLADGLVAHNIWGGQFYAEWEQSAGYTISYYANGGTGGGVQTVSKDVAGWEDLKILEPGEMNISRGGYTFMGWSKTDGDNNPIDYLPGRTAWGLTTGSAIDLFPVWQPASGSVRQATDSDSTSGTITYVYEVVSASAQTCRLLRVLSGTPISGSWTIPDMIHEVDGVTDYNWKVVACGETLAGDLRNVTELRFGPNLRDGLELLRNPGGLGNLKKFVGSSDAYQTLGGMLLNGEGTQLLAVPSGWNDENGSDILEIPGTVTTIAANACAALKNVHTVIIPENVVTIKTGAFANNYGDSIEVAGDGGISQVYFRGDPDVVAFANWSPMFAETDWNATACAPIVNDLDKKAVGYMPCWALEPDAGSCTMVVPEGVTAIADNAFEDCEQMNAVILPTTLESIGESAFNGCCYLEAVDIPASVTKIGDYAFYFCAYLQELTGGEGLIGTDFSVGVEIVGKTMLEQNADGTLGSAVTFGTPGEGDWILVYQGRHAAVPYLPELSSGCVGIAGGAIVGFDNLTEMTLPDTVRWVGDYAFDYCSNLRKITLCASTKTAPLFAPLSRNAMNSCGVEIYGSATCDTIGSTFRVSLGDGFGEVVPFKLVIGEGIRKIDGAAFARTGDGDEMDITLVTGGDDLVSVSRGAFANTTWATLDEMSYTPEPPEPDDEPIEPEWPSFTGYPHRNIGGFYVGYFGSEHWIIMPETDPITDEPITRLSPTAFDWAGDEWIESVCLASQLEAGQLTVEMFADANPMFQGFWIDGSAPNYTTIDGVLYDKDVRKLLFFPRGFSGDFTLPPTVASIPQGTFSFVQLSSLTIPDDSVLTTIPAGCFENSSVRYVTLGDNVAIIGERAFQYCFQLESITFGAGLVRIEDYAFAYGSGMLRELEFPKTLDTIGEYAFANGYLESVTFCGDAPKCAEDAFEGINDGTAYVSPYSKGWNGDPTSTKFPEPAVWRGLALEKQQIEYTYESWAEYNGLTGDDAAWNAKPAKWGGQWENAFVYLFGEGLIDGSKPLMTIDIGADGVPMITTPKIVADEDSCPFELTVIGSESVADWESVVDLSENAPSPEAAEKVPEGRKGWWLGEGVKANFFRVRLTND